jgi:drug/metabolite transporter (DMT)-like permease
VSAAALALVLVAAVCHATWNLAAKRSGGGLAFVWLTGLVSFALYVPAVLAYAAWRPLTWPDGTLAVIAGSGLIKTGYALLLQLGYRHGDFSLIYPLARGTGPLLATCTAIAVFGERPSPLALAGGLMIIASVFALTGGAKLFHADRAHLRQGLAYGFLCGCCIAGYTVWDQRAVSQLGLAPPLYDFGTQVVMCAVLTPFALRQLPEAATAWREHRGKVATVAFLGPTAYVLVLFAMQTTPVSYVAPAREVSILIGTFLGAKLLGEADASRRLLAAAAMVVGVIALALG